MSANAMTDTDSLIEAVARDLCLEDRFDPDGLLAYVKAPGTQAHAVAVTEWNRYLDRARLIVGRVRRWEANSGWRCVPVEPDVDMLRAGGNAVSCLTRAGSQANYGAMVSASPPPPGSAEGVKE